MMKTAGLILTALATPAVFAETYTWTGAVDNEWTNRFNWVMSNGENPPWSDHGYYPGYGHDTTVVFDPGAGTSLELTNSLNGWPNNTEFLRINVLSGSVKITGGNFYATTETDSATSTVYVAENATLDLVAYVGSSSSTVVKDGPGEWIQRKQLGYSGASGGLPISRFEIRDGVVTRTPNDGGTYGCNVDKVIVRDGASLVWTSYSTMSGIDLQIDRGGTVTPGTDGKDTTLDGISGEGTILAGTNPHLLYMTLKKRDYVFSGDCRAKGLSARLASEMGDHAFTVGSATALANLGASGFSPNVSQFRFAAGVGDFTISRLNGKVQVDNYKEYPLQETPLRLVDTVGAPIRLHVAEYLDGVGLKMEKGEAVLTKAEANGPLSFADMKVYGPDSAWVNTYDTWHAYARPSGVCPDWKSTAADIMVSNAYLKLGSDAGQTKVGPLSVVNATLEIPRSFDCASGYASGVCHLDKGTVRFDYGATLYSFLFPSSLNDTTGAVTTPWMVRVGKGGARFEVPYDGAYRATTYHGLYFGMSILPEEGVTDDGGVTFCTPNTLSLFRPIGLNGPVCIEHCRATVKSAAYADTTEVLGKGDFVLRNAQLHLPGSASVAETRIARGGEFRFEGSGRITLQSSKTDQAMTLTIGPPNPGSCPLVRGQAGVLALSDDDLDVSGFSGSNGKVFVTGSDSIAKYDNGRVKLPIFSGYSGGSGGTPYYFGFLTYDETNGFTDFTAYTKGADGGADSVMKIDRTDSTSKVTVLVGAPKHVSAVLLQGGHVDANITINDGATLRVGNGTDPACILMNNEASYDSARICGPGTLDFGTSEGVIAVSRAAGAGMTPPFIDARIKGSRVTYAGLFGMSAVWLTLGNDNDYEGGTFISGVSVCPGKARSFGTGPVSVLGGDASGAQINFTSPITLANDLEVSGTGMNFFSDAITEFNGGALWFHADSTVSGKVKVVGRARFSTRACPGNGNSLLAPSGKGTFTGVISGDAVQIGPGESPIAFAAENTYTGGTEIVQGTLALQGPCSVGTGAVTLDGGTLRFENTTAVRFANAFVGAGTVALAGVAPVTFTGDMSRCQDRLLDLVGTAQTFTELPPFGSITNSSSAVATIRLAQNLGMVSWDGRRLSPSDKIGLEIATGTILDLGGKTLTVRRLAGDRSQIVNGELVETNPRRGLMLLVR